MTATASKPAAQAKTKTYRKRTKREDRAVQRSKAPRSRESTAPRPLSDEAEKDGAEVVDFGPFGKTSNPLHQTKEHTFASFIDAPNPRKRQYAEDLLYRLLHDDIRMRDEMRLAHYIEKHATTYTPRPDEAAAARRLAFRRAAERCFWSK